MVDLWSMLQNLVPGGSKGFGAAMGSAVNAYRNPGSVNVNQNKGSQYGTTGGDWKDQAAREGGIVGGRVNQKTPQPVFQPSPLDQLLALMQGQIGQPMGDMYQPDLGDLRSQIESQVNPVYDARKSALDQLMQRTEVRNTEARDEMSAMYEALSREYDKDSVRAEQEMNEAAQQEKAIQGTLKKNIKGNYARVSKEQKQQFKELGIEDALPDVQAPQQEDRSWQLSQADQGAAQSQQYWNQLESTDESYYAQGAPLASLAGTNAVKDLYSMLEGARGEHRANVTELEGQRSSDIMTAFNQLSNQAMGQAAEMSQGSSQQTWDQLMDLYGVMSKQYGGEQAQGPSTSAQTIATGIGLSPQDNQQFQNAVSWLQSTPALTTGQQHGREKGKMTKTTVSKGAQLARDYARKNNLSKSAENAVMIWLEQLLG